MKVRAIATAANHVPRRRAPNPRYGIGEGLTLTYNIVQGPTPVNIHWAQTKGNGVLSNKHHGRGEYTCHSSKESVTIELRSDQGVLDKLDFEVIEPAPNAILEKFANAGHRQGHASAGFKGRIIFKPNDVSFMALQFKEGRGTFLAQATGVMMANQGLDHDESAIWLDAESIVAEGTRFAGYDTSSRDDIQPPLLIWDPSDPMTIVGKMERAIRWWYRVRGQDATKNENFMSVTSRTTVFADGSVLQQKADASRKAQFTDPTDPP